MDNRPLLFEFSMSVKVKIDLSGLDKFADIVNRDLAGSSNGPIRKALKQWGFRYRSFAQERFDKFSKGGGDWAPLSPYTVARRRRQSDTILRDTNTLFTVLQPVFRRAPGAIENDIPQGIVVGFGGPAKHPTPNDEGGRETIVDIAEKHQRGGGNLPQRKIIVDPTQKVINQMADDMQRAINRLLDETDTV